MKYESLEYFYAVMSGSSNDTASNNKRKSVKTAFTNILKNVDAVGNAQLMQRLLGADSAIQLFLGFSDERHIALIKEMALEIKKNPYIIKEVIKEHMGENSGDNVIDYLNRHIEEVYPEMNDFRLQLNEWQADVIQGGSPEKPQAPTLDYEKSSSFCCFGKSKKREKQPLLEKDEAANSCRLI